MRTASIILAAVGAIWVAVAASPAQAGDGWRKHGRGHWHHHHHHYHGYRHHGPPVVYVPRHVYRPYHPPPVYYAPPPVYYGPPALSFGLNIPLR